MRNQAETGDMSESTRIRIRSVQVLSDDWYLLKKTTFDYLRRDGTWQTHSRETYDRGNGAVILLFNRAHRTVVLTRQFRFPAYVNGLVDGMLVEACAGLLDKDDPEACIQREADEETGFRIHNPRKVFEAYMSPGSEKLFFWSQNTITRTRFRQAAETRERAKISRFWSCPFIEPWR
jgi:GDP-mannose pyrophosphatase NudK